MTAKDCILSRRSIRKFTDQPVDHELLESIVATASYAPSWKNTQIVRYIAVEGGLKDRIAGECTTAFPVLIAVTVIKNRCGYERDGSFTTPRKDTWQMFDAGIASQTFCLAAHEAGLGSVIMGIFDREKAETLLELSSDRELVALIPVGYPAEEPAAPRRKDVSELITFQ